MKNKWGRRIGVFALAAISSALMFSTNAITAKAEDTEWNYGYTGNVQTFTAPHDGNYRLEVWGAQGGQARGDGNWMAHGGKGGYATGIVNLKAGDTLYICVGGAGEHGVFGRYAYGGYNGGGRGCNDSYDGNGANDGPDNDPEASGAGGGATHIALNINRGVLSNYASYSNEVLIVAGGGGGASWNIQGGSGGGTNGGTFECDYNTGGFGNSGHTARAYPTQTSGYAFGRGMDAYGIGASDGAGGGGGGWYGGYSSGDWMGTGGSGGSGHVNTAKLSNTSMSNGVRQGNGYARVTAVHTHTYTSAITTAPTCTKDGIRTYTCIGNSHDAACGHQYTEIIPKLNHDCSVVVPLGTKGYEVPGRPGYFYTRKCSRCGSHYCREELGQFLQQTFVKYMDTNGNYPNDWKLADSKLVIYDQYYSWEYADRQEFKGNSVYYKVTKANDNYVYIERKKYQQQVIVYYQNADGLGDADATFTPITEVSGDYFYGSQVTWKYTPRVEYNDTVTSSRRDGTVQTSLTYNVTDHKVTEFWAFRKLVTLDINGEYLWKASVDASDESGTKYKYPNLGYSATDTNNNMGTFDIYINGKLDTQKGHNVRDYYRTDILYGSKWEVENIESDAGKHYYGSDVN